MVCVCVCLNCCNKQREEVIELIRRAEMEEIEQAITTAKNILTMLRSVNTGMSVDLEDIRNMQYTNDEVRKHNSKKLSSFMH